MAKNKTRRLRPTVLQADLEAYAALLAMTGYRPSNPAFELAEVTDSKNAKDAQQIVEVQKSVESDTARDDATAAEWAFHEMMLGVKNQVKAQFGEDSNEFAALGLKKRSEYKTGRRSLPLADGGKT